MTAIDVTTSFARTLVDEFVRGGVTHAVVSPGSRNTPLLLALERAEQIRVDVVLDERSTAFQALGSARATGRPAVVCCTSGTAAANFHPAVIEAHHGRVPMIVCTADRPPELRDWGAGQTINQTHLYGNAVRWFHDPGPPLDAPDAPTQWRALASRAIATATRVPAGPVHLNLPFREPLVPTGAPLLDAPGRADGAPWSALMRGRAHVDPTELRQLVRAYPRGVLVCGWGADLDADIATRFAAAAGWPIIADAISGVRTGEYAISTYEALLRIPQFADAHRPDIVVRVGAPLTSKIANAWLATSGPHALIDPACAWLDPQRACVHHIEADANALLGAFTDGPSKSEWLDTWCEAERRARDAMDRALDKLPHAIEGRIARDLTAALPVGSTLLVASSLPVRALEWCMAPRTGVRIMANRGANGIDGFVSTAVGVAHAARENEPTIALCGDLCFLHDTNGLLACDGSEALTFVVIDNNGGGIFSHLPQHDVPEFERCFATPQTVDLVAVARAHGVNAERVSNFDDWEACIGAGVQVLVVGVDRARSVDGHRECWEAAAPAVLG